ncbi:hypothetical protein POKO110462_07525 [Pontibacter korlensis]|uniref:Lipoprotein n=1 Tax=Pontibacter korlensis TaxID=400092 RepID=A0A0E3ZD78_9BACT|nr:hypothetical protein [Pontibacter korlensis]AKD02253.1 hypothetical protein PKOR_02775 [Pontibacter korlensis]
MSKKFFPVAAIALLFFATSCGEDSKGTSTEVVNSNQDELVNPRHIRGYGNREPGTRGPADPPPYQYYAFSTRSLPASARQELEGRVAVEMVTTYYLEGSQLSDLARQYNATSNSATEKPEDTDVGTDGSGTGNSSGGSGSANGRESGADQN